MKLTRLTAAIVAAATAITPLSLNIPLCTASTVFAEETAVSELPAWVPDDFDSALEFRNTHGNTYIADGLICLVFENEDCSGVPDEMPRYQTVTTENALDTVSRKVYTSVETGGKYEVVVYRPLVQGDIEVAIVDIMLQSQSLDLGYRHAWYYYTFNVNYHFLRQKLILFKKKKISIPRK